jgi:hypothetical protein
LFNIPFYRGLLYNPQTNAWMMAATVNNQLFNSPERTKIIDSVLSLTTAFETKHNRAVAHERPAADPHHFSDRIKAEMKFFLIGSVLLSALILLFFSALSVPCCFRWWWWALAWYGAWAFLQLMGYRISLLTALIPPLDYCYWHS